MRGQGVRLKLYRGKWYAVWIDGGATKRASLRTPDRAVAERNLAAFLAANEAPRDTAANIMRAYLADREGRPSHSRSLDAWKRLEPTFGHLRPADIGRPVCREYAAIRSRRAKPGTIIKELSVLRAALRWHDKNTPAIIEMPRHPPPRDRYLTREEYRALRDAAAPTPHAQLFIITAYATAGRAGAVLELTWDRVDFRRGLVQLATEDEHGNKGRALVPMNAGLRAALERAKEAALTGYVIEYAGRPVASIRKGFQTACARAGLKGVTPHVLRHTAAVHLAESGLSMSEIAQYLGHRDSRTTERVYARYSPDHLRRAASALE
jgi:integrase